MKLLLHTCCAPCSTYVVDKLRKDGFDDITAYWYNINIHPFTEYKVRLDNIKSNYVLKNPLATYEVKRERISNLENISFKSLLKMFISFNIGISKNLISKFSAKI